MKATYVIIEMLSHYHKYYLTVISKNYCDSVISKNNKISTLTYKKKKIIKDKENIKLTSLVFLYGNYKTEMIISAQ